MGKSDKKSGKLKKDRSSSYAKDSHEEKDFSDDGGNGGEQEEQTESDDSERPGYSQWIDEDEEIIDPPAKDLRQDMATMSFGALLKAKKVLAAQEPSESGEGSSEEETDEDQSGEEPSSMPTRDQKEEKKLKEKRANKHAPMEMSSKRPVSRKRRVVEETQVRSRDPRFGGAAGEFSADHFRKDYGFLLDTRTSELATIRENLAKARKLYASSPASLREERWEAVEKLERTLKRTESTIHRAKKDALEREAIAKVKREEHMKRSKGKKAWYPKKDEQEKIKLKARFESMSGREIKKALEKKQKKTASKEKKARPFGRQVPMVSGGQKRAWVGDQGNDGEGQIRDKKRRRLGD